MGSCSLAGLFCTLYNLSYSFPHYSLYAPQLAVRTPSPALSMATVLPVHSPASLAHCLVSNLRLYVQPVLLADQPVLLTVQCPSYGSLSSLYCSLSSLSAHCPISNIRFSVQPVLFVDQPVLLTVLPHLPIVQLYCVQLSAQHF